MKITSEEFIQNFHSLDGITVGERRKNLFLLLEKTKHADISKLNFSSLQPKNPLEEKFKVDVLIYFKRIPDLMDLLKCENPILIHKILKSSTWFEEAFKTLTAEQLVTLLFPYVSFKTKEKIINKLAMYLKDSQQANEFYKAIKKTYGAYLASKLLASCSLDIIMDHIKSSKKVMFTPKQLQIVMSNYPESTVSILQALKSNNNYYMKDYRKIFKSLAKDDVLLHQKFGNDFNLSLHFGRRATKKLINLKKQEVIENPAIYYKFLHNKQIAKSLRQDFVSLFINLFPKLIKDFEGSYGEIFSIFKKLPTKMRNLDLFLLSFEKVYGSQLWKHPMFITSELLRLLTPEERENVMKMEYNSSMKMSEDKWYSYLKCEKSLPVLKKKYYLASNYSQKSRVLDLLVETCSLHADKEALTNICTFMGSRCDTDEIYLQRDFLLSLRSNFKLAFLEAQQWTSIHKLIESVMVKRAGWSLGYSDLLNLKETYIHYRLINNLPINDELYELFETRDIRCFNIIKENPHYEKQCLFKFGKLVSSENNGELLEYLCAVINWNKRHPDDEINLFNYTHMLESLKDFLLESDTYDKRNVIMYVLQMKSNLEKRADFLKLHYSNPRIAFEVINWLVHHELLTVFQNIETITHALLANQSYLDQKKIIFLWIRFNDYWHLDVPLKIRRICTEVLQKEKFTIEYQNPIAALSYLIPPDEFLKVIVPYFPSDLQADPKSEEGIKLYQCQQKICICLKNVIPPSQAIASISKFCKGDYLKLILQSLYSICNNTNEDKLASFFYELSGRAVSVRKHALHLTFRVLAKDQLRNMLDHFMKTETNVSIRKFILKCAFNFFNKNSDDDFWELIKLNLNHVDVNDEEAYEMIMQVDLIPFQYSAKYVSFMWDFLKKIPDLESNRSKLLNLVTSESIKLFPQEFCEVVIKDHFLKHTDGLSWSQSRIQTFTCIYIIYFDSQSQQEHLNFVFSIVKDYIIKNWNKPELRHDVQNSVSNFLKEFCLQFLHSKCTDKNILIKFVNLWNDILKPHEAFDEYLHLQFTLMHVNKLSVSEVGQKISELYNSLSVAYGPIVGMLCDKINFFAKYFLGENNEIQEENRYILIQNIIKSYNSVNCALLAILLMNDNIPSTSKAKEMYNVSVKMLEKKPEPVIQLYLQSHFSGITDMNHKYR